MTLALSLREPVHYPDMELPCDECGVDLWGNQEGGEVVWSPKEGRFMIAHRQCAPNPTAPGLHRTTLVDFFSRPAHSANRVVIEAGLGFDERDRLMATVARFYREEVPA